MAGQGPVSLAPSPTPVTGDTVSNVATVQRYIKDTWANLGTSGTVYSQRVITQDLELLTPIGGDTIAVGSLAAISPTLGAVTVDADLTLSSTTTTRTIYWKSSSTNYLQMGANALSLVVGATASDHLYLKRGSTTVMSFQGDSSLVTFAANITAGAGTSTFGGDLDVNGVGTTDFAGGVTVNGALQAKSATASVFTGDLDINGTGTTTCDGDIELASGKAFKGDHTNGAGTQRADGTFTFYAAASSGAAVTQKHDITFSDGLITGWVVT